MRVYILLLLAVLLFACSETVPGYDEDYNKMNGLEIKAAVALANQWRDSKADIKSFISSSELTVKFPDGREIKKALPSDEMYIAVAPYINYTHTCETHYLSTCQAELKGKTFSVKATSIKDENVFEGSLTALNNGFIELWLPRNETIELDISYSGKRATETISTAGGSRTCITTMILK